MNIYWLHRFNKILVQNTFIVEEGYIIIIQDNRIHAVGARIKSCLFVILKLKDLR